MQSPPPPVRQDHMRQDRRILDIAREQIKRFGAKRLTVVSVAEEAGMTHANVYRYFSSKLALCDALTTRPIPLTINLNACCLTLCASIAAGLTRIPNFTVC